MVNSAIAVHKVSSVNIMTCGGIMALLEGVCVCVCVCVLTIFHTYSCPPSIFERFILFDVKYIYDVIDYKIKSYTLAFIVYITVIVFN